MKLIINSISLCCRVHYTFLAKYIPVLMFIPFSRLVEAVVTYTMNCIEFHHSDKSSSTFMALLIYGAEKLSYIITVALDALGP